MLSKYGILEATDGGFCILLQVLQRCFQGIRDALGTGRADGVGLLVMILAEAIRDALAGLEVKGLVTGDLKFDENGDAIKNYAVIKTITDGQIVYHDTYNG